MKEVQRAVSRPYRFLPVVGMLTAIFFVSSQPGDHLHLPKYLSYDKVWHLLEYGLLAATCLYAVSPAKASLQRTRIALSVVGFALVYGLTDEFHQSFVPFREASLADVAADTLGAALVSVAWWWRSDAGHERETAPTLHV